MAVNKIKTNKETYNKIIEFLPKVKNKTSVNRDTIIELHDLGKEAGIFLYFSRCSACDNSKIISHLEAYVFQYENPE